MNSLKQSYPALSPPPDAFWSTVSRRHELGIDFAVFLRRRDGATLIVDRLEDSVLEVLCRPCRPGELADKLREKGWEDEGLLHLGQLMTDLERRGLVERLDQAIGRVLGDSQVTNNSIEAEPGVSILAIPTKNRPEALRRALGSWFSALKASGGPFPDIMIADDTTDNPTATKQVAADFAQDWPGRIYLLDRAFREKMAQVLDDGESGIAALALGLPGPARAGLATYGANRNLVLLACAGRTVAMADDDTIPDFRRHPRSEGGLALHAGGDPCIISPFVDPDALAAFGDKVTGSPLEPHFRLLGKRCLDLAAKAPSLDVSTLGVDDMGTILEPTRRVGALVFGSWGDSGMMNARYLLSARSQVDFDSGGVDYEEYEGSRLIFHSALKDTIGQWFCMGMHIVLDARTLLPPFSPTGRTEDGLWAACLDLLHPEIALCYPREAIFHNPIDQRSSTRAAAISSRASLNDILIRILNSDRASIKARKYPYQVAGELLTDIAAAPLNDFLWQLAETRARTASDQILVMEGNLAAHSGQSIAWDGDIELAITDAMRTLDNDTYPVPTAFAGDERGFAASIGEFGEILKAWPDLFRKAMERMPGLLEGTRMG